MDDSSSVAERVHLMWLLVKPSELLQHHKTLVNILTCDAYARELSTFFHECRRDGLLTADVARYIISREDMKVRESLAGDETAPGKVLDVLIEDDWLWPDLALNINLPESMYGKLFTDTILREQNPADAAWCKQVLTHLAINPNTPATIVSQLASHSLEPVRRWAEMNPNLPRSIVPIEGGNGS